MSDFGRFYLDKEKDIVVLLTMQPNGDLTYTLRTPHHHTGNLITNLARLCGLPLSEDPEGLRIIKGTVPCYVDGYNQRLYIFRLGNTKVANIYPDGRIEMKASIPAISKTLMSQTKDYQLSIAKTIVKTYIFADCKFETDLHTHMNGNLQPETLIALGIMHQVRYPLYYIKKLNLACTQAQWDRLMDQRAAVSRQFEDSPLTGRYLDRRIDDNTFINFADLILGNLPHAAENIEKIAVSLTVPKDGQAVFANLEKTYLYRYVLSKGVRDEHPIVLNDPEVLPHLDVVRMLLQMRKDRTHPVFARNTLLEDELLWIARQYASKGIRYVEITDTVLTKPDSVRFLAQAHRVLPAITEETGVVLRFLAGIRRIPLTIIKDQVTPNDYLAENLRIIRAIASDPYVAGADIIGEEINDILSLRRVIDELVRISACEPGFVIRIHAGENDGLRDNVANSLRCVRDALAPGQEMPLLRIGHGLYTCNLRSDRGKRLLADLRASNAVLEFQITSNVRLNNLSTLKNHPLKTYLNAGIQCVQGTDGGALYGTDSIDEELALEKLLELNHDDLLKMRRADEACLQRSMAVFERKKDAFRLPEGQTVCGWYSERINSADKASRQLVDADERIPAQSGLGDQLAVLPADHLPVVIAGGSFNNSRHKTHIEQWGKDVLDRLLAESDPGKVCFVVGHRLTGYEGYLVRRNRGRFPVIAIVPNLLTRAELNRLRSSGIGIMISIESSGMGLYKSFAYEVFKRQCSVLLAFDGNSAAANLMQEAKNGRYKCRIYANPHARDLWQKARSLTGYVQPISALPPL